MKILILICIFASLACGSGRPNENCWLQCDTKIYSAQIECPKDARQPCTCLNKDDADCGIAVDLLKIETWEQCHDLAKEHSVVGDDLPNAFFRWENTETSTLCFFLLDCNVPIPGGCAPFTGATCVAGKSDVDCDPLPEEKCDRPAWDPIGIHWTCTLNGELVDTYAASDDTSKLLIGTKCQTIKDCASWTWTGDSTTEIKKATVECDKTTGWKSDPETNALQNTDETPLNILPDQTDGRCDCLPLTLNPGTLETPGLSLICDTLLSPDADDKILLENGNACLLTCDGHFRMFIECHEGEWMNTGAFPFLLKGPDDIKC